MSAAAIGCDPALNAASCSAASIVPGQPIAIGCEANVFAVAVDRVVRVDRIERHEAVRRALIAVECVRANGGPVPRSFEACEFFGRSAIRMERLEPTTLLDRIAHQPTLLAAAGRIMGRVHAEIHLAPADPALPTVSTAFRERFFRRILPDPVLRRVDHLSHSVTTGRSSARVLHGEFHAGNLLMAGEDRRWLPVDWGLAMRGSPEVDVAYTLSVIERGAVPASTSSILRHVAPVARSILARAYLREYERTVQLDRSLLSAWAAVWRDTRGPEGPGSGNASDWHRISASLGWPS